MVASSEEDITLYGLHNMFYFIYIFWPVTGYYLQFGSKHGS